jgi:hypothetical protein
MPASGAPLPALIPPLLVLHPDASPFVPLSVYDGLERLCPGAELTVWQAVRHGLSFSHGRECAERLLSSLRALATRSLTRRHSRST